MTKPLIISTLGYSGLLPFIAAVVLLASGVSTPGWSAQQLFLSYSAVILAFLGGALWGRVIAQGDSSLVRTLLVASNLIAILVWVNLNIGLINQAAALVMLAIGYVLTLSLDLYLSRNLVSEPVDSYAQDYLKLRVILTTVVVFLHAVALVVSP